MAFLVRNWVRIGGAVIVLLCGWLLPPRAMAADRLILRNLDILAEVTVKGFDEDGIVLDAPRAGGGDRVTWDEVERGRVAIDQERFDALLAEFGPPLYRIRQRLRIGDDDGLAQPAELLYPRFSTRNSQTAYMVCQATMWSRLARGEREAAVEPYLRCFELLRSQAAGAGDLPGNRRLATDPATAIAPELVPVWFDEAAAKAALASVQEAIRTMPPPRPEGVYVYYATLALAAGEVAEADRVLPSLRGGGDLATWREIIAAQREAQSGEPHESMSMLRSKLPSLQGAERAAALYWVGLADVQASDEPAQRDGLLALLALPAEFSRTQPELAAAGLYHAAAGLAKLKDDAGAAAIRQELITRYASTRHAALARQ